MDLSIVITHHREADLLRKCLNVLKTELENLKGAESEIIVVLSECEPEALESFKREFPAVRFLPSISNLYYVRSANRGLKQARGEFILIMNDDVIASKGSIGLLLDFLKNNQKIGLLGPKIIYPDSANQQSCFRFYTPLTILCRRTFAGKLKLCRKIIDRFLYKDKNLNLPEGAEIDWLSNGAGALTKKECIEKVGLLDERFCHYFSDVDWCRRFWQNGYKVVYFPQAVFCHFHGKRSQGRGVVSIFTNRMTRMHVWDGMKYFWKWKGQS